MFTGALCCREKNPEVYLSNKAQETSALRVKFFLRLTARASETACTDSIPRQVS